MRKDLTQFARGLRRQQTEAGRKLWARIRNRQLDGWKFNRQVPCGPYVLDFFCFEADLAIELDGGQHAETRAEYDAVRTDYLAQRGLRVLRFWNGDVLQNIVGVLERIYVALGHRPAPSLGALKRQRDKAVGEQARRPLPEGRGEVAPIPEGESE